MTEALVDKPTGGMSGHPARVQTLVNARVPSSLIGTGTSKGEDDLVQVDLTIVGGKISIGRQPGASLTDLQGRIVWPRTVDCHTHLDKGMTWARSPNPDGTFGAAGTATSRDRDGYFDETDLRRRVEFQLAAAYATGTAALRSHVDADPGRLDRTLGVLAEIATDWQDCILLQLCPFTGADDPALLDVAKAAKKVSGVLSLYLANTADLASELDDVIGIADRLGLALDVHADETLDPSSHCLRHLAEAVLKTGFQGPVLAGHGCSLMVQPEAETDRTLDLLARAGIAIVCLPLCNTYLMDRTPTRTPRVRGGTLVHEMRARGIPVAYGSDNVRDGYNPYGDLDMIDLFRHATRTLHLDHPVGDWPASFASVPGSLIKTEHGTIREGGPADLIVFNARSWSELIARPQTDRTVIVKGQCIEAALPPNEMIDDLKGMAS